MKNIDNAKIVSFDVFDTLIFRVHYQTKEILTNPDDMFRHMEVACDIPGFADARIAAEAQARKDYASSEIKMQNIYGRMPSRFWGWAPREEMWEIENTVANPEMLTVYNNTAQPIIITTDIYLSKNVIMNMLQQSGFYDWKKLYVSSAIGKTKASGKLFSHIANDLGIAPNDILHIGDNKHSDFDMAKKMGFMAQLYTR